MAYEGDIFDITNLHLEGDFNMQVRQIMRFIRLTRTEVENLQLLFNDLQRTLEVVWPGCRVHAFGSIVTGLGIKSSDMDCYISLPSWQQVSSNSAKNVLRARTTLKQFPQIFQEVFAIPGAKVPIVKFYHVPTQRHCDINFNSPSGVENSKLLAYFMGLDNRVMTLAVIIKYWAKLHQLTGTNLMTSYALILLVIFYLQQKYILPSVYQLQRTAQIVDNWNVSFDEVALRSGNNESLYELLGGFFKYYRDFKYDKFIISPFLGQAVTKESFSKPLSVPSDFKMYRTNLQRGLCKPLRLNTALCIQDPFDHSKNCSVGMYPKLAKKVMSYLRLSAEVFHKEKSNAFLRGILSVAAEEKPSGNKKHLMHGIAKNKLGSVVTKTRTQTLHKMLDEYRKKHRRKT